MATVAQPAQAAPKSPPTDPTAGACGYAPLADQICSTWVGLPPDPKKTSDHGTLRVTLRTNQGDIRIDLDRSLAPGTVLSFLFLLHKKYFAGTDCHRLTAYQTPPAALSVLQCGDPIGTGWGDPGTEGTPEDGARAIGVTIERAKLGR